MSFEAFYNQSYDAWDYILGDPVKLERSILVDRYYHLMKLNDGSMKVACRDPSTNKWSKWVGFPGMLAKDGQLVPIYDVHRSVLENEIVIESDYPTYEENYEAAKVIGKLMEAKGFSPSYYYSGSKSIHIHVLLDFKCFLTIPMSMQQEILSSFRGRGGFVKEFMKWLREQLIKCWGMGDYNFDEQLINATHMIRCPLSRNKKGYKTFMGFTYKDLSFVPYICNEKNRIYPELGELRLSSPDDFEGVVEEFLQFRAMKKKYIKAARKESSLARWMEEPSQELRECVKFLLSEDFTKLGDGHRRALFILWNELHDVEGYEKAMTEILRWNDRCGTPFQQAELDFQTKAKHYTLTCDYIHTFLSSLGCGDIELNCIRKVYKSGVTPKKT